MGSANQPEARGKGRREAMSPVDSAWLRMERPTNPMMITGVLMLAGPVSLQGLRELIEGRFLAWPRFRQRAVDGAAGADWVEDIDFDLNWHVQAAALPGRDERGFSEREALERFASQMASTPLDRGRPLWQFHLVERYEGGCVLLARIHHCYADGVALVRVLLGLTDPAPHPHDDRLAVVAGTPGQAQGPHPWRIERMAHLGLQLLDRGLSASLHPSVAAALAQEGAGLARELVHVLALPADPPSPLRVPLGATKRVAWAAPLPLDEVKAVARACACTVNDVLVAAAAGALRRYMLGRGARLRGITLRASVPVNLRAPGEEGTLGNQFGLVFVDLPVGEANPVRRVRSVAASMDALKQSRQAVVAIGVLATLGVVPGPVRDVAVALLSQKASAVVTNVAGPQQPLYLAGRLLRDMMFWVPQTGAIGIGLSILSYDGQVHFGVVADAHVVPDPTAVVAHFGAEFEALLYIALMADWDGPLVGDHAEQALHPPSSPRR